MGLRSILAKLGILRFGTKSATWKSGRDVPEEFLMEGVYDADKDLAIKAKHSDPNEKTSTIQAKDKKAE